MSQNNGNEPQLGGENAPQLGGSNYYLMVNHHNGGDECEILPYGYATEAQAKLALIDWLHENHPQQWTLSDNGSQFIFFGQSGKVIAGQIVTKAHADELLEWDTRHRGSLAHQLFKRDSSDLQPPDSIDAILWGSE